MGEGDGEMPLADARRESPQEVAALSARVAALERQVTSLLTRLAHEGGGSQALPVETERRSAVKSPMQAQTVEPRPRSTAEGFSATTTSPAFVNRRYATALVAMMAFSLAAWIARHAGYSAQEGQSRSDTPGSLQHEQRFWLQIGVGSIIAINLIAILATVREIAALWGHTAADPEADLQQALAISAFLMLYGAGLLAIGFWRQTAFVRWQALLLIVYTIAKTFLYDMRSLSQGYRVASFMGLGALLLAVSFAYQKDWLTLRNPAQAGPRIGPQIGENR